MSEKMSTDWVARAQGLQLQVRNFVGGRWQDACGEAFEKFAPRNGRLLCRFGKGEPRQVDEAVACARSAFVDGRWSKVSLQRRKDVLGTLATLIEKRHEELALLESIDVGKPISDALGFDIPATAATFRHCAESGDKVLAKVFAADATNLSYQVRRPWGVVAGIVGWNFPLVLAARKIAPALMTGNSLVLKPSEVTSLATARLAECALEAGVPEGVLNVVHGDARVGEALALHKDVDMLTFTGSTATGKRLLTAAGQSNMKRLILECGGKAPNIVFDDAPDLDSVANQLLGQAFRNQGQVCTASSRLLIQEGIKEEFMRLILKKVSVLQLGDPLRPETRFGALVSGEHQKKVLSYIQSGQADGANIVHQSSTAPPFSSGFYVPPTIFDGVKPSQKIAREEIFGPVLCVMSFRDEEEALRIANGTIYGLSAIVWTRDLGRAHRMAQGIEAGWIVVNATCQPVGGPAGGVMSAGGLKESGIGVEGGIEGLEAFTSQTTVQLFV